MARKKKRPPKHGHYRKVGHGKYEGHTRTVSLKQIHARYYYKKHGKLWRAAVLA